MREQVIAMLTALGVTGAAVDPLLDMVITNVQWRIKNLTNLREVPEGLESMAVSMAVCGYFEMKKAHWEVEGFLLLGAGKQIQEGDTNTVFAIGGGNSTPEQRLDSLINFLINGRMDEIYRYRRLVW